VLDRLLEIQYAGKRSADASHDEADRSVARVESDEVKRDVFMSS